MKGCFDTVRSNLTFCNNAICLYNMVPVFFTTLYIWRRFPPINLRYMSLRTTSRLVLTLTSFMYENQPELIDTYFSHEYCFHFEKQGSVFAHCLRFLQSFYERLYVYMYLFTMASADYTETLKCIHKLSNTPK